MKWEVKETPDKQWGVFLMQEFCKTDEPVCYGVSITKKSAQRWADNMNDPEYWIKENE